MTDENLDLPDGVDSLREVATDPEVDSYEREAAIKKLAAVDGDAGDALAAIADGEGLTAIERELARTRLADHPDHEPPGEE